jgi:hypothetical protein
MKKLHQKWCLGTIQKEKENFYEQKKSLESFWKEQPKPDW